LRFRQGNFVNLPSDFEDEPRDTHYMREYY